MSGPNNHDPSIHGPSECSDIEATTDKRLNQTDRDSGSQNTTAGGGSTDRDESKGNQSGLTIRCPHCHNPIELIDDAADSLDKIDCPSCGSHFSLIDQETNPTQYMPTVKQVGHFELIEQIGVGGFGTVWKARDRELDRAVAVKIPRKNQLDTAEMELFFREARAAAQLKHPNIVSVHEVGRQDDTVYIVSDLIRGVPLDEWLKAQPITPRQSAELCITLCDAVDHAHESGVIHRDLKPGNILLDADNEPHVMDFGLAKREAGEITMTVEGRVMGTPAYMSPEQASGDGHKADRRTDIYSLGVIIFQLLTGELPFRGTPRMLLHQVLNNEPRSPRTLNDRVPRDLETITLKCLQKDPDRRYDTARELGADLCHFLAGEPISARPIGRIERGIRWCRRYPMVAGLSAAVLALCLSVAGVLTIAMIRISESRDKAVASQIEAESAKGEAVAAKDRAVEQQRKAEQASKDEAEQRARAQLAEADAKNAAELAQQEADTAGEVSNFLANMFKSSTPFDASGFLFGSTKSDADMTAREILDRGTQKVLTDLAEQPDVQADLLEAIGSVYLGIDAPEAASPLLEKSMVIRKSTLPSDHSKIASLLFQQGYGRFLMSDREGSEKLIRQSLEMRKRVYGEDHSTVTKTKLALGIAIQLTSNNYKESENLLRGVLEQLRASSKSRSTEYGVAALALCASLTGRTDDEAELAELFKEAKLAFEANPETTEFADAISLGLRARLMGALGQHDAAGKLYLQTLEKLRNVVGIDHWTVMWMAWYAAETLEFANRNQQALAILDNAGLMLPIDKNRARQPFYIRALGARASILFQLGKKDEAIAIADRLIELSDDRMSLYQNLALQDLQLQAENYDQYRKMCRLALRAFSDETNANIANNLAWNCSLLPNTISDRARLVDVAKLAHENSPGDNNVLHTYSQALYRAERFTEAREQLDKLSELNGGEIFGFYSVLDAMVTSHEGNLDGAKSSLEETNIIIQSNDSDSGPDNQLKLSDSNLLQLKLLYEEAKALIESSEEAVSAEDAEEKHSVGTEER